jgi:hypothetical protein|tara:strand:- start:475 stop:648 length:174 start_codon:yes stop_codon:yes gene_type:complete
MTYPNIDSVIADIGKSNVTPKQLILAAYEVGLHSCNSTSCDTDVEEVEEVVEEVEES